jgi:hypothetical protein
MLWNKLWLVIPNLTLYFLYLCCFTLHCFILYSATVSGITWCIQPWCVYGVKHIKCWQGGREEAVLYGLWWDIGSGRGSYINSQINWFIVFNATSSNVFFDVTLFLKTNVTSSERVQIIEYIWLHQLSYLRLWCLTSLSTIFQLYVIVRLIGGGNRRKPSTCRKSLTNFTT